jgi:hypothetical protein
VTLGQGIFSGFQAASSKNCQSPKKPNRVFLARANASPEIKKSRSPWETVTGSAWQAPAYGFLGQVYDKISKNPSAKIPEHILPLK